MSNVTYEWSAVIERLKYHRERLHVSKKTMAKWIKERYGKSFWHLSDQEIIELGQTLRNIDNWQEFAEQGKIVKPTAS